MAQSVIIGTERSKALAAWSKMEGSVRFEETIEELQNVAISGFPESRRGSGPDQGGIGLSICRAIIEAHHGKIEALTPDRGGAMLRVTLPMAKSEVAGAENDGSCGARGGR